uniref:Glomulin, FKBP associated protein a n=1 Tax=Myripristis murdjan TaxID=586833 RepID=A0A667XMT9_9TELE
MALEQFSDVVQKCQAIHDDSYTTEDYDVFTIAGRACIEEGDSTQVLSIVVDEKNKDIVRCMGWNLLPPLVQVLLRKDDRSLPHCLAIFSHLLEVCSPKELLVGLLEQVEEAQPDVRAETLLLLLNPLQKVLLRLGRRKPSSLGMVLSTLLEQVAKLPVPHTKEQEEDDVFSLCRCCTHLMAFIRPFVQEARYNVLVLSDKEDELRTELLKFCMKTLCQPLLEVHLKDPDTLPVSPLRDFATEILSSLSAIGESLPSLVFLPLLRRREVPGFLEEEVRYPKESLSSLAHLLFVHHLAVDAFPAVYSPVFTLRSNMEHINQLLSSVQHADRVSPLHQELYEKSLVRLEDGSLHVSLLEIKTFISVPRNLVKVMTLCPVQHLRTKGLKVLQLSIDKFDTEAKYNFLQSMLKISNHSGVEGYIIKNIKNQIDFSLKPGHGNPWFEGVHLLPLLRQVLVLPDGPETDLLQYLDRVMESLNLLRYLVIRDKVTENQTGIWTELYKIEDKFLKPLRVGVNMSRAHYEMELKNTMENKKSKVKESCDFLNFTVIFQALHSALHTFDMIESVLVRIEEIISVDNI